MVSIGIYTLGGELYTYIGSSTRVVGRFLSSLLSVDLWAAYRRTTHGIPILTRDAQRMALDTWQTRFGDPGLATGDVSIYRQHLA